MWNSSCLKWRALEWSRGNTAALRTGSVPDQESQLTMPMSSKAPLDSLILPLEFSDSQQVTDNVPCRFLAQLWDTSMQGKLWVPHTWDFPFFFSLNPTSAALTKRRGGTGERKEKEGSQSLKKIRRTSKQRQIPETGHVQIPNKDSKTENNHSDHPQKDFCKNPAVMAQLC